MPLFCFTQSFGNERPPIVPFYGKIIPKEYNNTIHLPCDQFITNNSHYALCMKFATFENRIHNFLNGFELKYALNFYKNYKI